ncbi:MAG: oxygen-independent coproporphyrinogen III oxidase [Alphaproteobacteria bacterium]|nr:oxygen-independent coproporphyrinogen III oxidase [Alphaproteobacteria bacterium]
MDPALLAKYARPVPRYTSYPTAPHFHAGVTAADYRRWLAEIPADTALSLYLHLPFCARLCWFCGCHTKIVRRYDPLAAYLDGLMREIDLVADCLGGNRPVSHVHWGGGTPNSLSPADTVRLAGHLRGRFRFTEDMEFAVELDPRTLSEDAAGALARAGVTRASLGVQDLDPGVQRAINRVQPFEVTAQAVAWLRAAGIQAINIDLMYGLPGQTVAGVAATADQVATLAPDRLALFGYAHVPWMKKHQRLIDEAALPDPAERARQAAMACARLEAAGYRAIGLDHFARADDPLARAEADGRLNRNFQGYTTDAAPVLLGFGASAIGRLPQGYVQNATPIHAWKDAIAEGCLAVVRGIAMSEDDRFRAAIIERLMCDHAVDLAAICADHGRPLSDLAAERDALAPLAADGVVALDGSVVRVPDGARPLVRTAAAVFDRYLQAGAARHSQAV